MAERAARSGIQRVHVLTWRDLDDPAAGGSEVHAAHLCADLVAAGLEVTLRTGRVAGAAEEVDRGGVRVHRRGGRVGVFPTAVLDERRGRLGPVDGLIDVFHGLPFFAPVWARRTPQVGVVHHVHLGIWHHLLPAPGAALGHLLERFAVPLAYRRRQLVAVAESTRAEVIRSYRARPDLVDVAPNGVSDEFTPGGARSEGPLVLAVARFMPQKALPDLVSAFAEVRARVPAARLVLVGDGPDRPTVVQAIAAHGLEDAVDLVGRVSAVDLVGWYRRAWVVASTSLREGFGLTLAEGGACATPAVARRIPGHSDAIVDGRTGFLADDLHELADRIVQLLEDPEQRDRMGAAARAHAAASTWERASQVVLEALCRDADRRR
jgi:glycosyltransferase involved in cell wall biosynthesis